MAHIVRVQMLASFADMAVNTVQDLPFDEAKTLVDAGYAKVTETLEHPRIGDKPAKSTRSAKTEKAVKIE